MSSTKLLEGITVVILKSPYLQGFSLINPKFLTIRI